MSKTTEINEWRVKEAAGALGFVDRAELASSEVSEARKAELVWWIKICLWVGSFVAFSVFAFWGAASVLTQLAGHGLSCHFGP
jgi:hypothetical protein